MTDTATRPFSRPFDLADLDDQPRDIDIAARADECAAVATAFDLPGVASLGARLRLSRAARNQIDVRLDLNATVTRICVVSADAFTQTVSERAMLRALIGRSEDDLETDPALDPEAPDDIPIPDTMIDLGALTTEQLALALDPYPRKPGAEPPAHDAAKTISPFAALASLRPKREPDETQS